MVGGGGGGGYWCCGVNGNWANFDVEKWMMEKVVVGLCCCELLFESEDEGWFDDDFVCHCRGCNVSFQSQVHNI